MCRNILRDDLIALTGPVAKHYPVELRRVTALVDVDGELRDMVFLTNNLARSAQTADLYRCRWGMETFFKELTQNLQPSDFLGHNERVIK
jgi:IS4 transposase